MSRRVGIAARTADMSSVKHLPPCPSCSGPQEWQQLTGGDSANDPNPGQQTPMDHSRSRSRDLHQTGRAPGDPPLRRRRRRANQRLSMLTSFLLVGETHASSALATQSAAAASSSGRQRRGGPEASSIRARWCGVGCGRAQPPCWQTDLRRATAARDLPGLVLIAVRPGAVCGRAPHSEAPGSPLACDA